MRVIYERCGICLDWIRAGKHCGNCGAYHVFYSGRHEYYNKNGIEMKRALPLPLHFTIERYVARVSAENK